MSEFYANADDILKAEPPLPSDEVEQRRSLTSIIVDRNLELERENERLKQEVARLTDERDEIMGVVVALWECLTPPDEEGDYWVMDEGMIEKELGEQITRLATNFAKLKEEPSAD